MFCGAAVPDDGKGPSAQMAGFADTVYTTMLCTRV